MKISNTAKGIVKHISLLILLLAGLFLFLVEPAHFWTGSWTIALLFGNVFLISILVCYFVVRYIVKKGDVR
jgi:hypothetical protein